MLKYVIGDLLLEWEIGPGKSICRAFDEEDNLIGMGKITHPEISRRITLLVSDSNKSFFDGYTHQGTPLNQAIKEAGKSLRRHYSELNQLTQNA